MIEFTWTRKLDKFSAIFPNLNMKKFGTQKTQTWRNLNSIKLYLIRNLEKSENFWRTSYYELIGLPKPKIVSKIPYRFFFSWFSKTSHTNSVFVKKINLKTAPQKKKVAANKCLTRRWLEEFFGIEKTGRFLNLFWIQYAIDLIDLQKGS